MWSTILGVGIGAAATFFADPQDGRRRRTLARNQFISASRRTRDALDSTARDLTDRSSGVMATIGERLEYLNDRRLVRRIPEALGLVRPRRRRLDWAPRTRTLAAAVGLAATGLYIAKYARPAR